MLCAFILFPTVQMTILFEFHINIKKNNLLRIQTIMDFQLANNFVNFLRDNPGNIPAMITVITLIDCSFLNHVYDWTVIYYIYIVPYYSI